MTEQSSRWTKFVTSLKVAALASVLGAVVLAAEHRLATEPAPDQTQTGLAAASPGPNADYRAQLAPDYFPAQFPAPSGPVSDQPPTF